MSIDLSQQSAHQIRRMPRGIDGIDQFATNGTVAAKSN
jgi:hypothetical protein